MIPTVSRLGPDKKETKILSKTKNKRKKESFRTNNNSVNHNQTAEEENIETQS